MPAIINIPFDPVLHIGPLPIHLYGVGYAAAFYVGFLLITPFLAARGIPEAATGELLWRNIVLGLIGARLFFVIQQPDLGNYLAHPVEIIAVWKGGMAFLGAMLVCIPAVIYMSYRARYHVWVLLDACAIFATLPQAIGRLGNIVNGDILGPPSTLPWAFRYTNPSTFAPSTTQAYQPANLYELLISLLLFAMVMAIIRRRAPSGVAIIAYIAGYAISQFLIFFVRATEPVVALGLKQAQLTSLAILLVAVPLLIAARRRYPNAWLAQPGDSPPGAVPADEGGAAPHAG